MPAMPQKQELAQTATPRSSNDYPSQTANLIPIKDPSSRNLPPEIAEADRQARELYNQKQYTKSVSLFLKACTGGAVGDCEQLGNIYQYGLGLPYNYSLALPAYSRACDGAVAKGCDDLAYMYRQGYGVTADYAQAMTLYARACDMGEASDCEVVGSWSETGTGDGKVDYAKAAVYFAKGCDKNNSLSCSNLGELYRRGDGVEKNIDKAKTLFNKSCDLGYQQGCLRVKEMQ
jgi:TPR repeat protein